MMLSIRLRIWRVIEYLFKRFDKFKLLKTSQVCMGKTNTNSMVNVANFLPINNILRKFEPRV